MELEGGCRIVAIFLFLTACLHAQQSTDRNRVLNDVEVRVVDNTRRSIIVAPAGVDQPILTLVPNSDVDLTRRLSELHPCLALSKGRLMELIMGQDGRYSNSKFQAVVWFSVVIVIYGANVIVRGARLGIGLNER